MTDFQSILQGRASLALRPLGCRDLPQIAHLAQQLHLLPRADYDSLMLFQPEGMLGWVAETSHRLAGFVLCSVAGPPNPRSRGILPILTRLFGELVRKRALRTARIKLIDLCVATEWPRPGVERALLERLEQQLHRLGDQIEVIVPESNLTALLFLREVGYKATTVLRGCYGDEDGNLLVRPRPDPARQIKPVSIHAAASGVTGTC